MHKFRLGTVTESYRRVISSYYPEPHDGLLETPERAAKAMEELLSGVDKNPLDVIKLFKEEARQTVDVAVTNIPVYSLCEHHLLPFFGTVDVVYKPDKHVLGISKFARMVDILSKRLQVQERLTREIGEAIRDGLQTDDVLVRVTARHMCMEMRGVKARDTQTVSLYTLGSYEHSSNLQVALQLLNNNR